MVALPRNNSFVVVSQRERDRFPGSTSTLDDGRIVVARSEAPRFFDAERIRRGVHEAFVRKGFSADPVSFAHEWTQLEVVAKALDIPVVQLAASQASAHSATRRCLTTHRVGHAVIDNENVVVTWLIPRK